MRMDFSRQGRGGVEGRPPTLIPERRRGRLCRLHFVDRGHAHAGRFGVDLRESSQPRNRSRARRLERSHSAAVATWSSSARSSVPLPQGRSATLSLSSPPPHSEALRCPSATPLRKDPYSGLGTRSVPRRTWNALVVPPVQTRTRSLPDLRIVRTLPIRMPSTHGVSYQRLVYFQSTFSSATLSCHACRTPPEADARWLRGNLFGNLSSSSRASLTCPLRLSAQEWR